MRAVLVFCEGAHDVAFITRSLGQLGGCTWVKLPIDRLPTPFGSGPAQTGRKPKTESLIVRRYSARELGSQHVRAAAHAPLPTFDAVLKHTPSDTLYILLRSDADRSSAGVESLVGDLEAVLIAERGRVDVAQIATALVFDADDDGVARRSSRIKELYSALFGDLDMLDHRRWVGTTKGPLGLFIFHDPTTQRGTLETLLGPMVEGVWPTKWSGASAFIDEHANASDRVRAKASEEIKARITIAGQIQCPGDPMSTVLGNRRNGLPDECFTGPHSQRLVEFLLGVPWP